MDAAERERRRREAELIFVGRVVSVTSCHFTEPVVLHVLEVESSRGIPYTEVYTLFGTDVAGGFPRSVGFWEEHNTCVNIAG